MIEIPFPSLAKETLQALIESFVLREGTDYGEYELSLEQKVESVRKQLEKGKLKILFDENEESCTIVNSEDIKQFLVD
jgi:uncharacterized protein YheU (UPF0270 family)